MNTSLVLIDGDDHDTNNDDSNNDGDDDGDDNNNDNNNRCLCKIRISS